MEKIVFECETITPMFIAGADGTTPELRAPSIKGAMRFWWRAVNGHLDIKTLREKESEIFGGSGEGQGRSKVIVRVEDKKMIIAPPISLTPHHTNGYCNESNRNCFYKNNKCMKSKEKSGLSGNFKIIINCDELYKEKIISLLKIVSILGAVGKRERRGFGSFRINVINDVGLQDTIYSLESVRNILNKLIFTDKKCKNGQYELSENKIILESKEEYKKDIPFINEVKIGNSFKDSRQLLIKIGEASHENNSAFTGNAVGGRFSSPEYVSIIKIGEEYRPVITSLNMKYKEEWCSKRPAPQNIDKREKFKEDILND